MIGSLARVPVVHAESDGEAGLFSEATNPPVNSMAAIPNALRMRYVDVHLEALDTAVAAAGSGAAADVLMELFPDTVYTAHLEKQEASMTGGIVYSGTLEGIPYSEVFLSVQGDVLAGDIESPEGYYQVQSAADGSYAIYQVDATAYDDGGDPMIPPVTDPLPVLETGPGTDDGSRIDLMVIYTPAARAAWGGTAAIQSQINLQVSATNQSYANSLITQRLRLVYTSEVNYNDSATSNWGTILSQLTSTSDGVMDEVHTWRNTYGADLVVMLIARYEYCGMGWLMSNTNMNFAPYGFSLVSEDCMTTGSYSMAHEMGHNMGAHHDRLNASGAGVYSYSYGYQAPNRAFRTVMAYNCSGGCARVGYWSNPTISYLGIPTGVDSSQSNSADNTRTLNNTASIVAVFRDGAGPAYTPSSLSAVPVTNNQVSLQWSINPAYTDGFIIERTPDGESNWQVVYSNWSWSGQSPGIYTDMPGLCSSVRYRVRAYNGDGYSNPSNEVLVSPCLPNAPRDLSATPYSQTRIDLNWTYSGSPGDDFIIERSANGGTTWPTSYSVTAGSSSYSDTAATCGTDYSYRMKSHGASGYSAYTSIVNSGTIPCTAVVTPTAATLHRINLSWTDASNNPGETYELERSPNGSSWTKIATLSANQLTYSDGPTLVTLACNTTYYYRVKAITPWGSMYSASTPGSPKPCAAPPAPTGLSTSRLSITSIRLNWTDVLDDEDYYRIERSPNGSTSWTVMGVTGVANITTYTDSTLGQNSTVYYRVVAVNAYGSSSASGVAQGKTYPYGSFLPLIP